MRWKLTVLVYTLLLCLTGCSNKTMSVYSNEYCKFDIDASEYDVVDSGDSISVQSIDNLASATIRYYRQDTVSYEEIVDVLKDTYGKYGSVANLKEDVNKTSIEFDLNTKTGSLYTILGKRLSMENNGVITCVVVISSTADSKYKKDFRILLDTIDFVDSAGDQYLDE